MLALLVHAYHKARKIKLTSSPERKFTEKLAQDFRPLVHQTQGWFRTHFFGQ